MIMKYLLKLFTWVGWHFHYQCLDDKWGKLWRAGRCWLNNSREYEDKEGKCYYQRPTWGLEYEWAGFTNHCTLALKFGIGDVNEDIGISIAIPYLFAFWLNIESKWAKALCFKLCPTKEFVSPDGIPFTCVYSDRVLELRFFDWALWWNIWVSQDEWLSSTPWYRQENFRPLDLLFGGKEYAQELRTSGSVSIPMPEGCYQADYEVYLCKWFRKRWGVWPFYSDLYRAEVKLPVGIPVPGKGENSWDCDDDTVNQVSFPAKERWQIIAKIVETVMYDRLRYGGSERMHSLTTKGEVIE